MKKIIFSVTNDLVFDQRMHRICQALSDQGYFVTLVGRKHNKSVNLEEQIYHQKRIRCFFNKGPLFYSEFNLRLFFFFLFSDFDILGAIDLDTILPAMVSAKLRRKKFTYDAHEYFTEVPELEGRYFVKNIWEQIAKLCIPKAQICYTVSNSLSIELRNRYKKEFSVIMNVPEKRSIENFEIEKEKKIIYFGAINKGRGIEYLIEAMKYLDFSLVIAGDGDLTSEIKRLAIKFEVEDKIEFTGLINQEQMNLLADQAMIGFNLLESSSKSYYYSLSNKFFYYMHLGIPGISNNFPEYSSVNNNFEVSLLTDLSVDKIVLAVNKLFNDKEYYSNLRNNAIEASKHYNWENEKEKLIKIYFEL